MLLHALVLCSANPRYAYLLLLPKAHQIPPLQALTSAAHAKCSVGGAARALLQNSRAQAAASLPQTQGQDTAPLSTATATSPGGPSAADSGVPATQQAGGATTGTTGAGTATDATGAAGQALSLALACACALACALACAYAGVRSKAYAQSLPWAFEQHCLVRSV